MTMTMKKNMHKECTVNAAHVICASCMERQLFIYESIFILASTEIWKKYRFILYLSKGLFMTQTGQCIFY